MKLYSTNLELKAIRSITTRSSKLAGVRSYLLANLDPSFFHYDPAAAAFHRLQTVARKRGEIMQFEELCDDPALPEDVREALSDTPIRYVKTTELARNLFDQLDKYRKGRILFQLSKEIVDTLKGDSVDVDELLEQTSNQLVSARSNEPLSEVMFNIGKNSNAKSLMKRALAPDDEVLYYTGFKTFDEKTGGLPSQGVAILAATTSGGKSTALMNLLDNMFRLNYISVANVSLEMNEKKVARRWASMKTGIPFWKFTKRALSPAEEKMALKAWSDQIRFGKKHGITFSTVTPKSNVTIDQVLALIRPYGFKVIGIDYIGLLDGTDSEDQWRKLSNIARVCKIFSEQNKCLIVLLAQLDSDSDKIRYSRGIVEHADNVWTWNYSDPKQRDLQIIPVVQLKARDAELYDFELVEDFGTMRVTDDGSGNSASGNGKDPMADEEEDSEEDHTVA